MSFAVAAAIGGAAIIGAGASMYASSQASNAQSDAANSANQLQQDQFNQVQQNQKPWMDSGASALSKINDMNSQGPQSFTMQDFYNNKDPAYDFDLQQGQQALERSAAAKGGLMSGGTLKDLTSYAQGQASNEYQNAYNRFNDKQNTTFNRLATVAGLGQTANGQVNQAGMKTASNIGGNMMDAANARGAAAISQGNTLSNLGSTGANTWMQMQMMNRYAPQQPGYPGSTGTLSGIGSIPSAPTTYNSPNFGTIGGQ